MKGARSGRRRAGHAPGAAARPREPAQQWLGRAAARSSVPGCLSAPPAAADGSALPASPCVSGAPIRVEVCGLPPAVCPSRCLPIARLATFPPECHSNGPRIAPGRPLVGRQHHRSGCLACHRSGVDSTRVFVPPGDEGAGDTRDEFTDSADRWPGFSGDRAKADAAEGSSRDGASGALARDAR